MINVTPRLRQKLADYHGNPPDWLYTLVRNEFPADEWPVTHRKLRIMKKYRTFCQGNHLRFWMEANPDE